MKKLINTIMGMTLLLTLFGADAIAGVEKVALCKFCNSSAFRNAAEVTALSEVPKLEEGSQYVFVFDVGTEEIRYYEVTREYIEICQSTNDSTAGALTSGPGLDPDDPGPEVPDCFSTWVTSTSQLTPPAGTVAQLREANEEFEKFSEEIQEFDVSDLPIGVIPLDSATDLIGPPSDSHNPETFRYALRNALSAKVFDIWEERNSAITGLSDLGRTVFGKRLDFENMDSITVNFPDGTTIKVEVEDIVRDMFGEFKGLKLKVDVTSASGDQLSVLPMTVVDFISFFESGFSGGSRFIENLGDLFVRGGGRVERNRSGGGCVSTMVCVNELDDEGNVIGRVCEINEPDPQLRSC